MGGLFAKHHNNPTIFANNGENILVVGPFKVPIVTASRSIAVPAPRSIQDKFEDYLKQLMHELEKHMTANCPRRMTIVFQGGGTLELPVSFKDWCAAHGIRIAILPDPLRVLGDDGWTEDLVNVVGDFVESINRG